MEARNYRIGQWATIDGDNLVTHYETRSRRGAARPHSRDAVTFEPIVGP